MTRRFNAPWGKLLYAFTFVGASVCAGAAWTSAVVGAPVLATVCAGTLVGCAAFAVRGYRLEGDTLVIERLGWEKRVSLAGLEAVHHDKNLIDGALRVGNGGLFAFCGWFWSRKIGWFKLAGNDILGRAVLLELEGEKWMITPADPETFVAAARQLIAD